MAVLSLRDTHGLLGYRYAIRLACSAIAARYASLFTIC